MPRPPTFGNAVVRYFAVRLLPDPPAAGGRLTEYVTRNGLVIVALAALVVIGGAWYLFAGDNAGAGALAGPSAGAQPRSPRSSPRIRPRSEFALRGRSARHRCAPTNRSTSLPRSSNRVDGDSLSAKASRSAAGDVLVELDSERGARRSGGSRGRAAATAAASSSAAASCSRPRRCPKRSSISCRRRCSANEARVAAARSRLNDTIIRAPFAGRVGLRNVSVGSLVNPGTVITTLDDTSVIKLDFSVPEVFLSHAARQGSTIAGAQHRVPGDDVRRHGVAASTRASIRSTRSVVVRALHRQSRRPSASPACS